MEGLLPPQPLGGTALVVVSVSVRMECARVDSHRPIACAWRMSRGW